MRALGVRTIGDYVVKACGKGEEAIARVLPASPLQDALLASLRSAAVDLRTVLAGAGQVARYDELVREATLLNMPGVVAHAAADPRYRAESLRPPRKIGRHLALFDCINCDKCLPACPNDANFVYEVEPAEIEYVDYRVEGGEAVPVAGRQLVVRERHQIATFQDFCNDCGNCDTFCPEDGGPYVVKPRLFGSLEAFRRLSDRDGFCVERREAADVMLGRLRGAEYRLEVDRDADQAVFTDGRVTLELRHRERTPVGAAVAPGTPDGHTLDVGAYLTMSVLLDGVLDTRRVNPVNA
jgi:putative selenate reductase